MVAPNHLNFAGLKVLVTRHMERAQERGLYVTRRNPLPAELSKMPAGLYRLKKQREMTGGQRPEVLNINFVFDRTIPALTEAGVFSEMTEAEADSVVGNMVSFASRSVKRAQEIKAAGGDHRSYYEMIVRFFTVDLIKYGDWIKRKKDIEEIIAFRSGMRMGFVKERLQQMVEEQHQEITDAVPVVIKDQINAIKRAGDIGMVEAVPDIIGAFREGGMFVSTDNKLKLTIIEAMEKLGETAVLKAELMREYGDEFPAKNIEFKDLTPELPNMSLIKPRYAHSMVTGSDGKIYIYGGGNYTTAPMAISALSEFWSFDPGKGEIENLTIPASQLDADFGFMYTGAQMVAAKYGKIYLLGGGAPKKGASNFWSYDIEKGRWADIGAASGSNLPARLRNAINCSMVYGNDGKLYVFGGKDTESKESYNSFYAYNPDLNHWTDISHMVPEELTPRWGHRMVVAPGGKFYLFGGYGKESETSDKDAYLNELWMLANSGGTWKWIEVSEDRDSWHFRGRRGHTMTLGPDGNIYIIGGENNFLRKQRTENEHEIYVFNYRSGEFHPLNMPYPKEINKAWHAAAPGPDGSIYVLGGYDIGYDQNGRRDKVSNNLWKISFNNVEETLIEKIKAKLREQINANS